MTGSRLGRRLVATHLLVVAVSLLVLAAGAAAGLPAAASVAVAVGAGSVLGAVLAVRTARWISGPLQEVGGALFTSLSGQNTPQLGEGAERLVLGDRGPEEVRRLAGALEQVGAELTGRMAELNRESGLREQILSSMSEGVVLADASGRILYANPAAEDLLPGALTLPSQLRTEGPVELTLRHPRRRDLKATCLRLVPHSSDDDDRYRGEEERAALAASDPLPAFRARLLRWGTFTEDELSRMEAEIVAEVRAAEEQALALPPAADAFSHLSSGQLSAISRQLNAER